jgi:hypothetical protein
MLNGTEVSGSLLGNCEAFQPQTAGFAGTSNRIAIIRSEHENSLQPLTDQI